MDRIQKESGESHAEKSSLSDLTPLKLQQQTTWPNTPFICQDKTFFLYSFHSSSKALSY